MILSGKREIERLCYAKLYEFELMSYAENKIRAESEEMANVLSEASVKTLGDYRALLRFSGRQPRTFSFKPNSYRTEKVISEIADMKERWVESARKRAFEAVGEEKELLLKICESEYDEIYKIKRCLC